LAVLVMLLLCCGYPCAAAWGDDILWLTPGQDRLSLSSHLYFLEDPTNQLTVQDVASPEHAQRFQVLHGATLRSGITNPTTYWLRLTYASKNAADDPKNYFFDLGQITKVYATLHAVERLPDRGLVWKAQGPLSRSSQPMGHPTQFTHFVLPSPTPQPQTVFLKVQIPLSIEAMPEISTEAGFWKSLLEQTLFSGALLGVLAILFINNLIIYFTLRYAGYLWYALLLLAFCVWACFLNGLFQDFAPEAWFSQMIGLPISALGVVTLTRIMFVRSFLPLKEYFAWGYRVLMALMVFYLPLIIWPFLGHPPLLLLKVYGVSSIASVLFVMCAAIICWRKGYGPARFFLMAYVLETIGSLFMFFGYMGIWLPLPITTFHIQQIGIAGEAILLSLALVQRVNSLRLERKRLEQTAQREEQEHQRRLRSLAGELVRSEERQRKTLADDLHDSISQNLATSLFNLRLLASGSKGPESLPPLWEICDLLRTTLEQTRTLTFDISPPVLHDYGLEAGLEWLAERFQERHGLEVSFHTQGALPCRDENLEVNLFRAAQELLGNAVKHSRANKVEINLACHGSQVVLHVSDDGQGMEAGRLARAGSKGFGLFSIRERLQALGGGVEIRSTPGQGTIVTLRAPWPREQGSAVTGNANEDDHTPGR
jgi:signal transduction histidine kinase